MMQNTNRAVGTAREQERAYANHRHRRGHRGGGPRRYFLRALPFGAGLHGAHRHGGQRLGGGGSRMPEAGGRAMRELRTLPYHDGVLGRGAFSDGKLSLSADVGGDLPDLIGRDEAQDAIGEVDGVYLGFGADVRVEGAERKPEVDEIRRRAIKAGLKLVDCPLRHLGHRARPRSVRAYRAPPARGGRRPCSSARNATQVLIEGERCRGVAVAGRTARARSALGVPWWPRAGAAPTGSSACAASMR